MLGLPYFISVNGLILGIVLLIFFALLTNVSYRYLHMATLLSKFVEESLSSSPSLFQLNHFFDNRQPTYDLIGFSAYGTIGAIGVIVTTMGINFGAMISYILLLGGEIWRRERERERKRDLH
jgi:hypothetical protein